MPPFIHHIEHEAHVDIDGTSQLTVEEDIARQTVPVAVEGKTEQFSLIIKDR